MNQIITTFTMVSITLQNIRPKAVSPGKIEIQNLDKVPENDQAAQDELVAEQETEQCNRAPLSSLNRREDKCHFYASV
jgi:hypothetical protein